MLRCACFVYCCLLLSACQEDTPCGGELVFEGGTCKHAATETDDSEEGGGGDTDEKGADSPESATQDDGGSSRDTDTQGDARTRRDAGTPDHQPDSATVPGDDGVAESQFGAECESHEQCVGDTDYCVISPVDPVHYCSASGCDEEPELCPEDWSCFDVGRFSPGEPHICMRP